MIKLLSNDAIPQGLDQSSYSHYYGTLGQLFGLLDEHELAVTYLQEALGHLFPASKEEHITRAHLLREAGRSMRHYDLPGSIEHLENAYEIYSHFECNEDALRLSRGIGSIHATNGEYEKAVEWFEHVLKVNQLSPSMKIDVLSTLCHIEYHHLCKLDEPCDEVNDVLRLENCRKHFQQLLQMMMNDPEFKERVVYLDNTIEKLQKIIGESRSSLISRRPSLLDQLRDIQDSPRTSYQSEQLIIARHRLQAWHCLYQSYTKLIGSSNTFDYTASYQALTTIFKQRYPNEPAPSPTSLSMERFFMQVRVSQECVQDFMTSHIYKQWDNPSIHSPS